MVGDDFAIEKVEIMMNDDQVFLANFFARRVRPSVIRDMDTNRIWWMRLKILICIIYSIFIYFL